MDTGKYAEDYRQTHGLPPLTKLIGNTHSQTAQETKSDKDTNPKPAPQTETQSQNPMIFLIQKSVNLMKQAQVYGQAYEQLQQNYMQVANKYQNQLMELLPSIAMLTAKTPLSSMTEDDLPQHIEQLYTTMPFQVALANTDKLVKGYYISKMNGINTQELDTADLMQVAENPAFAESTNDNLAQFLARLGGIIQMKMQTSLKEAGMVKDMYAEKLKEMQMHAQVMHYIANALVGMARVNETERHHEALENYWGLRAEIEADRNALSEKKLELYQKRINAMIQNEANRLAVKEWQTLQRQNKNSSNNSNTSSSSNGTVTYNGNSGASTTTPSNNY